MKGSIRVMCVLLMLVAAKPTLQGAGILVESQSLLPCAGGIDDPLAGGGMVQGRIGMGLNGGR